MLGENHDLFHELPEYRERIRELQATDTEFSQLLNEYHRINGEVERIEDGVETPSDFYTEDLKKQRLHLKDQLYSMLKKIHA
ncbi:MAG: DUF465 domain-containing protein [Gammaproteobacteria bacterium]|nr:DUF465 domain-containing protein [Gammaproteobacteria bacterium]